MLNTVMLVGNVKREPQEIMNGKMKSFMVTTWNTNRKTMQRYDTHHVIDVLGSYNLPMMHVGSLVAIRGSMNRRSSEKDGVKTWYTSVLAFEVTMSDATSPAADGHTGGPGSAPPTSYPPKAEPVVDADDDEDFGF